VSLVNHIIIFTDLSANLSSDRLILHFNFARNNAKLMLINVIIKVNVQNNEKYFNILVY